MSVKRTQSLEVATTESCIGHCSLAIESSLHPHIKVKGNVCRLSKQDNVTKVPASRPKRGLSLSLSLFKLSARSQAMLTIYSRPCTLRLQLKTWKSELISDLCGSARW
jgi:hypothetical protein